MADLLNGARRRAEIRPRVPAKPVWHWVREHIDLDRQDLWALIMALTGFALLLLLTGRG